MFFLSLKLNLKMDLPCHRFFKFMNSHLTKVVNFFNKLHLSALNIPFNNFKTKLLGWLAEHPFHSINEFVTCNIGEVLQF